MPRPPRSRTSSRPRIALVGCGRHARANLLPSLSFTPLELKAVCARHRAGAESCAAAFRVPKAYTDHREMFERERLDAVIVATPPESHYEIASHALRSGLDVFVEKPATADLRQARALRDLAARLRRRVMVGFMKRFAPAYREAKRIATSPSFGPLLSLQGKFCVGPYAPTDSFLRDVGIHHVDLLRFFAGEVAAIDVRRAVDRSRGGASYALAIAFKNGAVGSALISSAHSWDGPAEHLEIAGRGGAVAVEDVVSLRSRIRNGPWAAREPAFAVPSEKNGSLVLTGFVDELRHFARSVLFGLPPEPSLDDFIRDLELIDTIREPRTRR